jgi:hypothetical protein
MDDQQISSGRSCSTVANGEQVYIGTKIIKAVPMTECEFLRQKGENVDNREDQPGYRVKYDNNYISWSPKGVFEAAYRLVTSQEFSMLK